MGVWPVGSGSGACPRRSGLLVEPGLGAGGVGDELLGLEPQVDLRLGVGQGVAAVDDVPAGGRVGGVSGHVTLGPL